MTIVWTMMRIEAAMEGKLCDSSPWKERDGKKTR